jgi:hypothetical protein
MMLIASTYAKAAWRVRIQDPRRHDQTVLEFDTTSCRRLDDVICSSESHGLNLELLEASRKLATTKIACRSSIVVDINTNCHGGSIGA